MESIEALKKACEVAISELKDIKSKYNQFKQDAENLARGKESVINEVLSLKSELAAIKPKILSEKALIIKEIDDKKAEVSKLKKELEDKISDYEVKARLAIRDSESFKEQKDKLSALESKANALISEYQSKVSQVNDMLKIARN